MTAPDGFDRLLTTWLEEQAPMREPDRLLNTVEGRLEQARRLPGRVPLERWLPMQTTAKFGAIPRTAIILVTLGLLAALLTAIAVGQQPRLPPTGPATNGLIAFDSGGDIWVVEPDGTDARPLTSGPALDQSPTWSRDGTRLVYWTRDAGGGPSRVVVVDQDGSNPVTIATDEAGRIGFLPRVTWSPDGTQVAYSLEPVEPIECPDGLDGMCGSRIFVASTSEPDSANQVGDEGIEARNPDWSPDGKTLAFGGSRSGAEMGIYLMAPDGSDVRRLSKVAGDEWAFLWTEWSADGSQIITQAGSYPADIWMIPVDEGASESNYSAHPGNDASARWSPDGVSVAWSRGSPVTGVSPDGSEEHAILRRTGGTPAPIDLPLTVALLWSPDGTALLLGRTDRPTAGLRILDVGSGEVRAEIPTPGRSGDPSWQRILPAIS